MKIELRDITYEDRTALAELANNIKIWNNLRDALPHPFSLEDADNFINKISSADPVTIKPIFIDGEFCGMIGLHPQSDVYSHSAELGYWIGEPFWGKGIATEAVRLVLRFGFIELGIKRIYAGIYEYNKGSMRVLEKNDFIFEGTLRRAVLKNNKLHDEKRYAVLAEDYF